MSTITLTFTTKDRESGDTQGAVVLGYNDGILDHLIPEVLVDLRSSNYEFSQVIGSGTLNSNRQALNYANAINVDYKNIGGSNNIFATVSDNVVTVTAKQGEFTNFSYNGSVIIVSEVIDNTPIPDPNVFNITKKNTGDCDNIDYTIEASGGVSPYRFIVDGVEQTTWNGSETTVSLSRIGYFKTVYVKDSNDLTIGSQNILVPRKLVASEFTVTITKYEGYSDLIIVNSNVVAGTTPITYSLDGTNYKTENTFPGILPDTYTLYIKDLYGCVVTKTIVVDAIQGLEEQIRYLEISNLNSLAWYRKRKEGEKRNFLNSKPTEEIANISHDVVQYIDKDDFVPTQFKSSYPYHNITYKDDSGKRVSLFPILIQENLGFKEKVDCVLYPKDGKTAVYFNGGNEYEPDSSTVIGGSSYVNTIPSWAVVDRIVSIDGLGAFEIEAIGYDEDIKYWYFTISASVGVQTSSIVQVKYNKQDYNLYEVFLSGTSMDKIGHITLDAGYSFEEIDQTYETGTLTKITDNCSYIHLEWSDYYNKGGMVFQSETTHFARIKGMFQPFIGSDSETSQGDDRSYNLYQSTKVDYKLIIPALNVMLQDKYNSAAALNGFKVNGVSLIKSKQSGEQYGLTNIGTLELDLLYSGNNVAIREDELVLNPSTGIIGGDTPPEAIDIVPYDGKTRLITSEGSLISIEGDFIEVTDV